MPVKAASAVDTDGTMHPQATVINTLSMHSALLIDYKHGDDHNTLTAELTTRNAALHVSRVLVQGPQHLHNIDAT